MSCVFCEIAAGRAEASVVHADDQLLAFLDISPVTPGHTVVVPRRHATDLAELDPDTGGALFRTGQRIALALRRSGLRCEGVNLFLADGVAAGQEVFHVHLHVLPRFAGDGFRVTSDGQAPKRSALDRTAAAITAALTH
ncbi:MAG TPA: HIT family protein [Mycobacteriales bacterium]|nr:HIT family protein [Mycobacteriales bacterium]